MRATRSVEHTPRPYYHRVKTHDTDPEIEVQQFVSRKLGISIESNKDIYTDFNRLHPIRPDVLATRSQLFKPMHVAIYIHGVHWHAKPRRGLRDQQHRSILEASDYLVLEIAHQTRPNEQYWLAVKEVLRRVLIYGENIRYCGRIKDVLALGWTEAETVLIS